MAESNGDFYDDFPTEAIPSEIEDPIGGEEGVTLYDRFNLDQDYDRHMQE